MPSLFLDEEDDDLPFQPRKRRKRRHRRRDPTDDATDYAGMDEQDREFIEFNNEEEDEVPARSRSLALHATTMAI